MYVVRSGRFPPHTRARRRVSRKERRQGSQSHLGAVVAARRRSQTCKG